MLSNIILGKLREIVGAQGILTAPIDLKAYSFDGTTSWQAVPDAVVFPTTTEQVAAIMKLASIDTIDDQRLDELVGFLFKAYENETFLQLIRAISATDDDAQAELLRLCAA